MTQYRVVWSPSFPPAPPREGAAGGSARSLLSCLECWDGRTIWAQFNNLLLLFTPLMANSHPPPTLLGIHWARSQPRSFQLYNSPTPTNRPPFVYLFRAQDLIVRFSDTTNTQLRLHLLGNLSALLSAEYTFQPAKMSGHIARNKTELMEIIPSS